MKRTDPRAHFPRQMRLDQIDQNTGEVVSEGSLVWIPSKVPHPYGERWMTMTLEGLDRLFSLPGMGMREMRIFVHILRKLDWENFILIQQVDIVKATGIEKADVSRALKKLVDVGALIPGPKVGRSRTYRVSPEIGWKGSKQNLRAALKVIEGGRKLGEPPKVEEDRQPTLFDLLDGQNPNDGPLS